MAVLVYFGAFDDAESTLDADLGVDPKEGTRVTSIVAEARRFGLGADARAGMTLEDLDSGAIPRRGRHCRHPGVAHREDQGLAHQLGGRPLRCRGRRFDRPRVRHGPFGADRLRVSPPRRVPRAVARLRSRRRSSRRLGQARNRHPRRNAPPPLSRRACPSRMTGARPPRGSDIRFPARHDLGPPNLRLGLLLAPTRCSARPDARPSHPGRNTLREARAIRFLAAITSMRGHADAHIGAEMF